VSAGCSVFTVYDMLNSYPRRQPIVTGTSVLALKFKDGIMMAADNLGEPLVLFLLESLFLTV